MRPSIQAGENNKIPKSRSDVVASRLRRKWIRHPSLANIPWPNQSSNDDLDLSTKFMPPTKPQPATQSAESIEASVQAVMDEAWYWFPVRHHSAAVARQLETAIRIRKPKLILIEGPTEANHLIPFLEDRKTRPPVAIYSCFQDDDNSLRLAGIASAAPDIAPRWACWFPFVEYSPELVAIREAKRCSASVKFIDLPHYGRLAAEAEHLLNEPPDVLEKTGDNQQSPAAEEDRSTQQPGPRNSQTERLLSESNFYQTLAETAGYKSWDEGWDALFEFREFDDVNHFRKEMMAFCCAARSSCAPERIQADGTLERERFMMQAIKAEIAAAGVADDEVMIVCGGFHVFLDRNDSIPPPAVSEGTVYTTVVPYTYFRISDLSGYGAGNRAPQFYQNHWNFLHGKVDNPNAEYIVSVLQKGRKLGENLSSADAISVTQHARMLAALRGRSRPVLDDLHDALVTCCCKGDPSEQGARLQKAIDQVDIGNKVGRVVVGTPRLPIVDDFYNQIDQLDLSRLIETEQREKLEFDKRQREQFDASAFLHRIEFIGVPFCKVDSRPDTEFESGLIFRERWKTKWSPDVEAKLIEQNLLGDSIETAAVNQLRTTIAANEGNAGKICESLVASMQMDLPNLIDQVFDVAVTAIDEDSRFVSLCRAVAQLSVLDRYAIHHEMRRERIGSMFERAFARSCFSMIDIASAPDDQHSEVVGGLTTLADVVLKGNDESQKTMFSQFVAATLADTTVPFLKGALMGMTVEIRLQPNQVITDEIMAFAASPQDQMVNAGDFVHGVIAVSRASIMSGARELVDAVDELLKAAEWDVFITMLPRIRAGMEMLHARHRDSIASRVAERYGLAESQSLQQLEVSVSAAAGIVALDQKVAAIMSKWSFTE